MRTRRTTIARRGAALILCCIASPSHGTLFDHAPDYRLGRGLAWDLPALDLGLRLSALVQVDAAFFDEDRRALADDVEVRRGRVALRGALGRLWSFGTEADFSGPDPLLTEASLRRRKVAGGNLSLGYLKEPIGLEWQGSSRNATFLERALPAEFLPPYHVGARLAWSGHDWSAATGVSGGGIYHDDPVGGDWGVTARATYAPRHHHRHVLHFGISGAHRELAGEHGELRFDPRPESHLALESFVDTGTLRRVDDHQLLGVEMAAVEGPLSLQSEYLRSFVHRAGGRQDLQFDGWYVQGSWFLTGESRPYEARLGRFVDLKPRRPLGAPGGIGAWELALRYSTLDLDDGPISGGQEHNLTVGLNWYPHRALRVMANWVLVDTDRNSLGRRGRGEERPAIFQIRTQFSF